MSEIARGMREDEREQALRFVASIMGATREYWEAMWRLAPSALPEHSRILLADGRIASHIHLYYRRMSLGAASVLSGHIGDVCTDPACRHRGYGTRLLEDAAEYFRTHGAPLSIIISGVFGFYYHGGYKSFPLKRYIVDLAAAPPLPAPPDGYHVRRAMRELDLPLVATCYHEYNRRRPLSVIRELDYWQKQFWTTRGETEDGFMVAEYDRRIVAYIRMGRDVLVEAAYLPEHAAALSALFAAAVALARKRRLETLTVNLPADEPLLKSIIPYAREEEYLTTLVRVVDLVRLLEDVASGLEHSLERPVLEELAGFKFGVRLDGKAGSLLFSERGVKACEGIPKNISDVFDVDDLSLVELLAGRSTIGSQETAHKLARAFRAPAPYFWPMDTV